MTVAGAPKISMSNYERRGRAAQIAWRASAFFSNFSNLRELRPAVSWQIAQGARFRAEV